MIDRLTDPQIEDALDALSGWKHLKPKSALHKSFKLKDFKTAWSFMDKIAQIAENMDHHPEWSNIYNRVEITLTTHDAKGITKKDTDMAIKIEKTLKTFTDS